jgi:hypothetical protein
MINTREQVKDALLTVCDKVEVSRSSEKNIDPPLIRYACIADDIVDMGHERLRWRIAVYARTFEETLYLVRQVDTVMHDNLGYTRRTITPDDTSKQATGLYMKRMEYSALVNMEVMGVIKGSI